MSPRISIRLLNAQSDHRLLALAREGHERAFEALVHRYRRPLLRYARRMRLSEARAEDVLQQSFMQSWIALSRGVVVHDVRGWLYRIVHNTAVNAMRGPTAAHAELTQAVQDRAGLHAASNVERTVAMRDALGHVAALPDMQRQAIFLTAVDGQSHEEVAGTLGISTGALRGLLYRARHTLRSAAAALTPQPLLELAARGGDAAAPGTERALELAGGAGAAGIAGVLLKGGAAAVTAGVLATGAVLTGHGHSPSRAHSSRDLVAATASPGHGARRPSALAVKVPAGGRTSAAGPIGGTRHDGRTRRDGARRHGRHGSPARQGAREDAGRGFVPFVDGRSGRGSDSARELERAPREDRERDGASRSGHSGGTRHESSETQHAQLAGTSGSGETAEHGSSTGGSGDELSGGAVQSSGSAGSDSSDSAAAEDATREISPESFSGIGSGDGSGTSGSGEKTGDTAQPH
jgi:RNA polymerase sigma factor (sigma-70 family)